jgi:dTDP-glucose pyrophosphorylase/CBS domain-containing protein
MKWGSEVAPELSKLCVPVDATLLDALRALDAGAESIVFVCDERRRVVGTLTDGDIRRAILAGAVLELRCLPTTMRKDFASVTADTGRAEVLDIMRARDIGQLPILDSDGRLAGLHTIGQIIAARSRPNAAVILAGGRGTRLSPLTDSFPKPMLPVAGRPILERLVLHLMSHGVRRIYLSVNYLAHVIEEHFGNGERFGCRIEYLREERPLGTGGPVALLEPRQAESVLVLNGDLVTQCDIGRFLDFHEHGSYAATMAVRPYSVQIPFGVADTEGERLIGMREKPSQRCLINAGMYVLSPDVIELIPRDEDFPITDLFAKCLEGGVPVGAYVVEQDWVDVGRHEELLRARGDA